MADLLVEMSDCRRSLSNPLSTIASLTQQALFTHLSGVGATCSTVRSTSCSIRLDQSLCETIRRCLRTATIVGRYSAVNPPRALLQVNIALVVTPDGLAARRTSAAGQYPRHTTSSRISLARIVRNTLSAPDLL